MRSLQDVVKEIAKLLDKLKIEYVIVGGIAVSSWGNVRTTRDVDVILFLDMEDFSKLVEPFRNRNFLIREKEIKDALEEKSHFTIFDDLSEYHIDAKGVYDENDLRTLKNRRKITLDDVKCYIASPEDTIANKLLLTGEQDIKDAMGIYVRQLNNLDMDYLIKTCKQLNVYNDFLEMKKRVEKVLNP